jgi:hypothetical protein
VLVLGVVFLGRRRYAAENQKQDGMNAHSGILSQRRQPH